MRRLKRSLDRLFILAEARRWRARLRRRRWLVERIRSLQERILDGPSSLVRQEDLERLATLLAEYRPLDDFIRARQLRNLGRRFRQSVERLRP